jgi:MFS family permease
MSGLGLSDTYAPLALVALSLIYALVAWPAGALSDRIGPRRLLILSLVALAAAHLTLAFASGLSVAFAGLALWGLHMGLSQGLLSAEVARTVPTGLRGTGFGAFNLMNGLATLAAGTGAGLVWTFAGAPVTFAIGAGAALMAGGLALRLR